MSAKLLGSWRSLNFTPSSLFNQTTTCAIVRPCCPDSPVPVTPIDTAVESLTPVECDETPGLSEVGEPPPTCAPRADCRYVEHARPHKMLVAMVDERQAEIAQTAEFKRQGLRVVSDAEHLGMTRRILELRTANAVLEERCVRLQTDMVSVSGQANRLLRGFGFNSEVDRDAAIQRESLERLLQERESLFSKVARLTDEKAQMEEELDREISLRQRVVDMARCVEEERMQTVIAHEE